MKQIYHQNLFFLLFFCACVYLPATISAQCSCNGGVAPNVLTYTATVGPTNLPTAYFSFPQFDPALGTLNCVSLLDTISGITTTGVRNLSSVKTQYQFQLVVSNNISGPGGLGSNASFSTIYGPDSLDAYGTPKDTITYGPDPLFTNATDSNNTTNVASYYGHGTVSFSWGLSGGLVTLLGGLNYRDQILTTYRGNFRLNYYWCPTSILASSITDFSAIKVGDNILLQWKDGNEQDNNNYEVQYSRDGIHFTSLAAMNASHGPAGSAYHYQYRATAADGTRLYFRVKKNEASGKSGYSAVKTVVIQGSGQTDFTAYPNPATRHITLESSELVSGNLRVTIVNTIGQVMYSRQFAVNGSSNNIGVDLPADLKNGVYYLRVSNPDRDTRQVLKLFVQ